VRIQHRTLRQSSIRRRFFQVEKPRHRVPAHPQLVGDLRPSTTVAGGGAAGFLGDGGPATKAGFWGANLGIAVDAHGDLYIADDGDNRVRKVTLRDGGDR